MLESKVSQLERDVVTADRMARFWRKQINVYGEGKAEAFYRSLGLNHLEPEIKSVQWEGLTLSREPTEAEKLCVKSVAQAQDSSQQSVAKILGKLRSDLIESGMKAVKKLEPADIHTLTLDAPPAKDLRADIESIFIIGRKLVATELRGQKRAAPKQITAGDDDLLDEITEVTVSRVANDVQAKIAEAVARYRLMGLRGSELWAAVNDEMERGSVAYIDRLARGASGRVLNFGRLREAEDRSDEWNKVEYSAILDANVCEPCASEDGESASDESDLTPVPNPDCAGGDFCRCFHVFIAEGVM
jgi:hypothetical protein